MTVWGKKCASRKPVNGCAEKKNPSTKEELLADGLNEVAIGITHPRDCHGSPNLLFLANCFMAMSILFCLVSLVFAVVIQ